MGQSTKFTRLGLPHTGRPHGHVNLAESKHDSDVSHERVPAEPKLSPIRKRLISRVFRHYKAYKYTLKEEEKTHREKEAGNCSRKAD
ncbi:Mediator of DNA damage checkpoint 1 [Gossypium arboreum]|uniref:Mediator of DNA damage checkpoint 1 n=1 Tax=Gossypium arboreum TaxID=29729 RepID=A0A0B0PEY0_GOSAR|nr:Mediator of DNA damage checkpoint 1 [Gossypium arboreum]